jgi:DNA repair photolyase
MKKTEFKNRKSMIIRESGRSTDFLSPSFIMGCGFECTYCYCKRHKPEGLDIAKNIGDILSAINNHSLFTVIEKPNQTHEKFITYDIG